MEIGFIGAGKMGFTLGRHLAEHGFSVAGYFSKNMRSAQDAAHFTGTHPFDSPESLVQACDMVFLTVPDGAIAQVWEQIEIADLKGKIICHTSGSLSSDVFAGIRDYGAFGYSVHPLFPIHSKTESYKDIPRALITIEGHEERLDEVRRIFEQMGHEVATIDCNVKVRYHAAAVFASNLVVGLFARAQEMLVSCGFSHSQAQNALEPIFEGNCRNILVNGPEDALTGPVERCDTGTLEKHLEVLDRHERDIYLSLSKELMDIARKKNPGRDYAALATLLEARTR
ncbi:MAG: Rossmann-like and DUF2520 domain-containing protein [Eggerthellaceae bacterium]